MVILSIIYKAQSICKIFPTNCILLGDPVIYIFFVLIGCVWSYSCRGYRCKQGNMIDHEWISIQGVIARVFQIGRTRIFCLFTLLMYGYMLREELKKGLSYR